MRTMHALVVGEALIDVIDGVDHIGGSGLNTAVALARLGRPTRFATCVGPDPRGDEIRAYLRHENVHFANDPLGAAQTSTAIAHVAPDGSADYDIDLRWQPHPIDERALASTSVLQIGSLATLVAPGRDLVAATVAELQGHAWICYDLNLRPALTGTGADVVNLVENLSRASNLVKASDQDLKALHPAWSVEESAQHLLALGPDAVVVTRGSAGSTWYGRVMTVPVAAPAVKVVDSISAGDTFTAALIDALWTGERPRTENVTLPMIQSALARATAAANIVVTRSGANPPHRHELDQ